MAGKHLLHSAFVATCILAAPFQASSASAQTAPGQPGAAGACVGKPGAMGTARTVEVDTATGPDIGTMQYKNTLPLAPKEIVFTFDDGPNPEHTPKILDTLDAHCIKATFFMVGRYMKLHPKIVQDVWRRGHTVASHTWSHPILSRMSYRSSVRQIERGFDAAENALAGLEDRYGVPAEVAPFFRFPGLNHTKRLRSYLSAKDVAIFSCDMGTDDWRPISPWTLYKRALRMIEYKGSGVVIFHDTHHRTSYMLDKILTELARRGYTAVHMVPKGDRRHLAELARAEQAHLDQQTPPELPGRPTPGAGPSPYPDAHGSNNPDTQARNRNPFPADQVSVGQIPAESVAEASPSLRPTMAN